MGKRECDSVKTCAGQTGHETDKCEKCELVTTEEENPGITALWTRQSKKLAAKEIDRCVSSTTAGEVITPPSDVGPIKFKCGSKDPTPADPKTDGGDSAVYMKVVSSIVGAATVMHLV